MRLQAAKKTELARSEEATYNAARGNIEKLQAYLSCTICLHRDAAQQEIIDLRRQATSNQESTMYRNAQGDADLLQRYIDTCSVCDYRGAATNERDQLRRAAQVFTFHVCNNSSMKAFVAVMGGKDPNATAWTLEGWWNILPGDCASMGPFAHGWFYYMADAPGGRRGWFGSAINLCVPNVASRKSITGGHA